MRPAAAAAAVALALLATIAQGAGPLALHGAWARSTPPGASMGAVYLEIDNRGGKADRLLSVRTPAAARTEVHETRLSNGIASMHAVSTLHVAAGQQLRFEPGGLHLMLLGLGAPLREGERFPLLMVFERAGERRVEVTVRAAGAMGGAHAH